MFNTPLLPVGARFTFAVKMSPSKEIAEKKSLIVELDVLYEILDKLEGEEAINLRNIIQDILEGKVDREVVQKIMLKYEEWQLTKYFLVGLICCSTGETWK